MTVILGIVVWICAAIVVCMIWAPIQRANEEEDRLFSEWIAHGKREKD